jgi:hypothetical protein
MATKTKTAERPQKADTGPTCAVEGCDKPLFLRGLCQLHWADPTAKRSQRSRG